jgi:hypothetical protein
MVAEQNHHGVCLLGSNIKHQQAKEKRDDCLPKTLRNWRPGTYFEPEENPPMKNGLPLGI